MGTLEDLKSNPLTVDRLGEKGVERKPGADVKANVIGAFLFKKAT